MKHNGFVYDLGAILEPCSSLAFAESADEGGRQKQRWQGARLLQSKSIFYI